MTNKGLFGNRVAARANREERTLLDGLGLWGFSLLGCVFLISILLGLGPQVQHFSVGF